MQSVGTTIRTARLQAGLTLEQICAGTCIPVKILQALEEDDLRSISSAFLYRSFIRQFAGCVGIAPAVLEPAIAEIAARFPEPRVPGQDEAVALRTVVKPLRRRRKIRWLYPAVSFGLVLVACSGFYAFWQQNKLQRSPLNAILPAVDSRAVSSSVTPSSPPPQGAVSFDGESRFRVELSAVERTWLSIRSDGKPVYSGILEIDQTKVLEGHQEGQLRTGNAGGINIVFNGKPMGVAGPHGSIRTVVFTPDNYQVLSPAMHAELYRLPTLFGGWLLFPRLRR